MIGVALGGNEKNIGAGHSVANLIRDERLCSHVFADSSDGSVCVGMLRLLARATCSAVCAAGQGLPQFSTLVEGKEGDRATPPPGLQPRRSRSQTPAITVITVLRGCGDVQHERYR